MACPLSMASVQGAHHDGDELHRSGSFWSFLLSIDKDLADSTRQQGCSCGGRLHCANYPRAPRGGPDHLPEEYRCRFSFCCDRDGCRKRMTPPSVRFLGRKVYLGAVVILISAMRQGPTPRRFTSFRRCLVLTGRPSRDGRPSGVTTFRRRLSGNLHEARLVPVVEIVVLPLSLLEAFHRTKDPCQDWGYLLRFLSPLRSRAVR